MGVITTSDKKRDEAKEHINKAYKCILDILDEDTWGSNDYSEEYNAKLEETLITLIRLKRIL